MGIDYKREHTLLRLQEALKNCNNHINEYTQQVRLWGWEPKHLPGLLKDKKTLEEKIKNYKTNKT